MATVGSLFINVRARTAAFSKKMKGVRGTVARLAKGFGRMALKVAKFAAVLGGIAVAAIIALTKKGLAAVDTMAKLAQTVGASVESIQVLRHMATLGGVSIEKMDKSISKMSKNIGESAMGIGTANDALAELGLKATDLEKMSPDVMFGVIADELNKVGSTARRASIAYDIFGRAGQELLVTMKEGSLGISAMRQKLSDLGVIIGDKQAQMVEKANDAWADIGLVWQGLQNQLAVEFAPVLTEIANRIVEFIKEAGGMGAIAEYIAKAFFYAGATILDAIKVIRMGWLGLKASVIEVAATVVDAMAWAANKSVQVWKSAIPLLQTMWGIAQVAWAKLTGGEMGAGANNIVQGALGVKQAGNAKSSLGEFLELMAESLHDDATDIGGELLNEMLEGWNLGAADETFKSLKDKFMGEGFDLSGKDGAIELSTPDLKGVADTLSTAIGSMKVEGDASSRILKAQLSLEEQQLETSRLTLTAIKEGGALT